LDTMTTLLFLGLLAFPGVFGIVRPDGVGKLPALGWNSWNAFACDITEDLFIASAQAMIDLGLKDAGYEYVNIDDCWSVKTGRDNITQKIIPDTTKFPDGINGTAEKIHALGFKIGIYSSAGNVTCGGFPASLGFEELDATMWAEWGIDYLKYDNCGVPADWTDTCTACVPDTTNGNQFPNGTCPDQTGLCPADFDFSTSKTAERYRRMRDAITSQNHTIQFALCDWGQANVKTWGNETGSSWRMTGDVTADWPRIAEILNENSFELNYDNFWGHNDADMLEVGNGNLTFAEQRSHFAFWAAMKSPLLIGTNLNNLATNLVDILKNKYLLAFNQDPVFGAPAKPFNWDWSFNATNPAEFWSGKSSNGTLIMMLNTLDKNVTKSTKWADVPGLKARESYKVTDVWTGKSLGCIKEGISAHVAVHDTAAFMVEESCR